MFSEITQSNPDQQYNNPDYECEEKYRNIIEQTTDGVVIITVDGFIIDFNQAACDRVGYTKNEFSSLKITDILYEGKTVNNQDIWVKIKSGESILIKRCIIKKNKTSFIAELKVKMLSNGQILVFSQDTGMRKKMEADFQKVVEQYHFLSKASNDIIWDFDIVENKTLYSEGISEILGYLKEEADVDPEFWNKNVHPDDFKVGLESYKRGFKDKRETIQLRYRFRCKDGSYKHISDRGYIVYNESGEAVRVIGSMKDITYEKELEQRISKAIIDAREQERHQLGMELHDNINQLLIAALLYLKVAKKQPLSYEELSKMLDSCKNYVSDAINENRKLSHRLVSSSDNALKLKEIFENLIIAMNAGNGFSVSFHFDDFESEKIDPDIQLVLYRIAQEQMNNIIKHSRAEKIELSLTLNNGAIKLRIADNGRGFNTKKTVTGIGFINMKKRAELYAGKFSCNSLPKKGCEIIVEIPNKREDG